MPILGSIIKSAIALGGLMPNPNTKHTSRQLQERQLKKLLSKAQSTAFGEYYQFDKLIEQKDIVSAFKNAVPAHDYNSIHQQWWYRALQGEPYVTWPNRTRYFALSSGTSDASSKYIPVTNDMLRAIKKVSVRQLFSLARYEFPKEFYTKGILMLGGSTHLQYNGSYYAGDLSGITTGNIPFWFQHFYKPGKRISKERDWNTKLDEIVLKAKDWDIGVIVGVPAWLQILLEKIIKHYNLNTIHELWPNLSIYVHGGVSFTPYKHGFEKLLARPLTYIETYLASEGFVAYQSRPNTNSMELSLDSGIFLEFVPFTDANFDSEGNIKPDADTLTIEDVVEGTEYALLLTTCSGAYRYLIGDMVKFTNKARNEIIITGRTKHYMNLCGEHLSQENMNRAIELMATDLNIDVREFTLTGVEHESMFAHRWYIGCNDPLDPIEAAERIDYHLGVLNDDYRVERIEAIRDVQVEVYPSQVFYDYMEKCGKVGSQNKFPRVLRNSKMDDWKSYLKTVNGEC
ncbi:MAG: GH3 auxin-responsive promoter family protein [Bacteroidales bacterium]|nr:GH3 auxin-responsive promoter family protein [Bacteroidales bacterium]